MGGSQRLTGDSWSHLTVAQDEVRQDRADGFAPRVLETPDGDPSKADTPVMGVTCQVPSSITGRLVLQLKAEGEEERQHTFEKRLALVTKLKIGLLVPKINGDGPLFSRRFGCCAPVLPLCRQVSSADGTR